MTLQVDRYMPCQQALGAMLIDKPGVDFDRTETQPKRQVLSSAYSAVPSTHESIMTVHLVVMTMAPELDFVGPQIACAYRVIGVHLLRLA